MISKKLIRINLHFRGESLGVHADNNRTGYICRRRVLSEWKMKNGFDATYANLLQVFLNAGHSVCANRLCGLLRARHLSQSFSTENPGIRKQLLRPIATMICACIACMYICC